VLVFIDESGDPGFKLGKESSAVFVVSMITFQSYEKAVARSYNKYKAD